MTLKRAQDGHEDPLWDFPPTNTEDWYIVTPVRLLIDEVMPRGVLVSAAELRERLAGLPAGTLPEEDGLIR